MTDQKISKLPTIYMVILTIVVSNNDKSNKLDENSKKTVLRIII